jgi:DNA-directed RNA polymerase specialized sigma24 family protein
MDDRAEEVQRVLEAIDALTEGEPPEARARRLTELLKSVGEKVRRERRDAVLEMAERGMSYRQIAEEAGISFGRVRQIIADDPDAKPEGAQDE